MLRALSRWQSRGLSPAFHQRVLNTKLIADAGDDEIDQVVNCLRSVIKPRAGRQHNCTGLSGPPHVVNLWQGKRGLARYENQLPPLFQVHFRRPVNQVAADRMSDRAQRAPRTWADDHAISQERSAGDGRH